MNNFINFINLKSWSVYLSRMENLCFLMLGISRGTNVEKINTRSLFWDVLNRRDVVEKFFESLRFNISLRNQIEAFSRTNQETSVWYQYYFHYILLFSQSFSAIMYPHVQFFKTKKKIGNREFFWFQTIWNNIFFRQLTSIVLFIIKFIYNLYSTFMWTACSVNSTYYSKLCGKRSWTVT